MKAGTSKVVRVDLHGHAEIVERGVSASVVTLLTAAAAHGGRVLKPCSNRSNGPVVIDDRGSTFYCVGEKE